MEKMVFCILQCRNDSTIKQIEENLRGYAKGSDTPISLEWSNVLLYDISKSEKKRKIKFLKNQF
jgi:hypothetical protein